MKPASAIARMTTLRRSRQRLGLLNGESAEGDWMTPAMVAASAMRQVADVLAEEQPGRFRDADDRKRSALSERHRIQVHLENLVLRRLARHDERDPHLENLPARRPFARLLQRPAFELRQEHVPYELLRDRARRRDAAVAASGCRKPRRSSGSDRCPDGSNSGDPRSPAPPARPAAAIDDSATGRRFERSVCNRAEERRIERQPFARVLCRASSVST